MKRTPRNFGTYYVGATVADVGVLQRVRHTGMLAKMALDIPDDGETINECHMTLVPPFHLSYHDATALNLYCACAQLMSPETHPLLKAQFALGKMMTMTFGDSTALHFHVNVLGSEITKNTFLEYVLALRRKVVNSKGFTWRGSIPPKFHPHITVLNLKDAVIQNLSVRTDQDMLWNKEVQKLIRENNRSRQHLPFKVAYPTLYAKYEEGWMPLSDNPKKTMR